MILLFRQVSFYLGGLINILAKIQIMAWSKTTKHLVSISLIVSSLLLIGLIVYTLVYGESVSSDTKDAILLSELGLSIIVSVPIFLLIFVMIMFGVIQLAPLIFLSPFILTLVRVILIKSYSQNQLYDMGLSFLTILSTVLSSSFFVYKITYF